MDFIQSHSSQVIIGIFIFFGALEAIGGLYKNPKRTKDDWWIEILSFVHASAISKPFIFYVTLQLIMPSLFPAYENIALDWSIWLSLPLVVLVDDFIQYWYHRKAHEWKWLWNFHRPHHSGPDMGVLVTFRENIFYVLLIPNIYWLGIATYLGMGVAVAFGLVAKYLIIIGAHSEARWDQWLYKQKWLHPIAWIIERTISTPATHFAHHGKTAKDGISNPTGNFGNMFFFWDILFGTAIITRQYPLEFGIENDPKDHWAAHLYWPIIKSKKANSEIGSGYVRTKTELKKPVLMEVEANKNYWWCSCGYSNDQPFCNGSHNGTKHKPKLVTFEEEKKVAWCTCKQSNNPPFCDGSHKKL